MDAISCLRFMFDFMFDFIPNLIPCARLAYFGYNPQHQVALSSTKQQPAAPRDEKRGRLRRPPDTDFMKLLPKALHQFLPFDYP